MWTTKFRFWRHPKVCYFVFYVTGIGIPTFCISWCCCWHLWYATSQEYKHQSWSQVYIPSVRHKFADMAWKLSLFSSEFELGFQGNQAKQSCWSAWQPCRGWEILPTQAEEVFEQQGPSDHAIHQQFLLWSKLKHNVNF